MNPDVLIIGGGVIGLSIARELRKKGVNRITLLEKGRCGEEASWAAAGMLSPQTEATEATPFFDLCCASRAMYPEFAAALSDETGIDIELDRAGTLYLAFTDDGVTEIRKRFDWQNAAGLRIENLSGDETIKLEPAISKDVREALFFPNDWQVENRNLLAALKRYAENNGVAIREHTQVENLVVEDGRVTGAVANGEVFRADITVVATGAWTSLIKLGDVEMPLKIEPVRGQVIMYRLPQRSIRHVLCSSSGYLVPRRDGRILAGSTLERVGFDKAITDSGTRSLSFMAGEIVPELAGFAVTERWSGLRPCTSDTLPVIGGIDGFDGIYMATGHFRNGILLAPITAKLVAENLVNNIDSAVLRNFGTGRFFKRSLGTVV